MKNFKERILGITPRRSTGFFRPVDWTAFWGATAISFAVYFLTLGPSVGLEDSGELATAGDHLGVPHPPGYPFWTMCSWVFCRIFSWVTYMGQPTPAWAISCLSAVFGAFAAGCTAMLITRSANDMLDGISPGDGRNRAAALAAGLGGSLVFAFSPVEWSQSTIVEIYSLNALFLMAVLLLSYRWMRKPSDKILWLTAFIFGLGLTNYQVLLLAAVPLAIIMLLRNIRLFRDFAAILIPVVLTALVLGTGAMFRASSQMDTGAINKFEPLKSSVFCPSGPLLWIGIALLAITPFAAAAIGKRSGRKAARMSVLWTGGAAIASFLLAISPMFTHFAKWDAATADLAPLADPRFYGLVAALLALSAVAAAHHAMSIDGDGESPSMRASLKASLTPSMAISAAAGLLAFAIVLFQAGADDAGYTGPVHSFMGINAATVLGIAAIVWLSLFSKRGAAFAVPVAAVQLTALALLEKGFLNGLTDPNSWWFIWPIAWNFTMLALAYISLPTGRSIVPAMLFAELGVSFYAYMPIVSDLRNPPMNWAYPRTWDGFKHAITRGQYEAIKMPTIFSQEGFEKFCGQLGTYFEDLRLQFTLVVAALALLPFSLWKMTLKPLDPAKKSVTVDMTKVAAALYIAVAVPVAVFSELFEGSTGGEVPLRLDKVLLVPLAAIALVGGLIIALREAARLLAPVASRFSSIPKAEKAILAAKARLGRLAGKLPKRRFSVSAAFRTDAVFQQWLIALGVCFAVMSLGLVALADIKGDIQDGFIQKVKFISSHGIFSLWIGYGLVVGIMVADRVLSKLFKGEAARKRAFAAICVAAAMSAAIPIYENYTNDDLITAMGSAEQDGHTFGWQFGNYQLRGAEAIREELSQDEEPLPNPLYPAPMDEGAVFFGGTDPGRFVPTYMIYSADVRPDIYLITQNALADDTYMSVERDLYGDEIWIPSKDDCAAAFGKFFRDTRSGRRQQSGEVKTENGRIQVTGAQEVMGINSILSEMMFRKERLRRSFYVEESYQIDWMFPYLEPHGLIMKIRPKPGAVAQDRILDDMEFWDWYMRRLLADPALRRDFAAQKAFSKLRTAIAGLYSRQGFASAAARAFREAVLIYPLSPESSFRYIQEELLPSRRFDEVEDILAYTDRKDPKNKRTTPMRAIVAAIAERDAKIEALLAKMRRDGDLSPQEMIDLSELYSGSGRFGAAAATLKRLLSRPGADRSWTVQFKASRAFVQCRRMEDALKAMREAVRLSPRGNMENPYFAIPACEVFVEAGASDLAEGIVDTLAGKLPRNIDAQLMRARVKLDLGKIEESWSSLVKATRIDARIASEAIEEDQKLSAFIQYMMSGRFSGGGRRMRR